MRVKIASTFAWHRITPLILLSFVFCIHLYGQSRTGNCQVGASVATLNGENVQVTVLNQGDFYWNPGSTMPNYMWPTPPGFPHNHNLLFASGLWFGGKDAATGRLVISAQTYRSDGRLRTFWPGPIVPDSVPRKAVCNFWDKHFSIDNRQVDSFLVILQNNPLPLDTSLIPSAIRYWPGKSNPFFTMQGQDAGISDAYFNLDLAPFVDADGNQKYNPALGDYPKLDGKLHLLWWVMNDQGNVKNFVENEDTIAAASLEYQISAYTMPGTFPFLKNSTFIDCKVINKGTVTLDSAYIGFYADADLGNAGDDRVQCDLSRNMMFFYNGDNMDEGLQGYGLNPPTVGIKAIDGPLANHGDGIDNDRDGIVDEPGEKILMSTFKMHENSNNLINGEPLTAQDHYNHLSGKHRNGTFMTNDGLKALSVVGSTTPATTVMLPGNSDPVGYAMGGTPQNPMLRPAWTEITASWVPGDRRGLFSAGPFIFPPGESFHYTLANLVGFGSDNLGNITKLEQTADSLDSWTTTQRSSNLHADAHEIVVFPNPGKDHFFIKADLLIEHIRITDLHGRQVADLTPMQTQATVHLPQCQAGIYVVKVQTRNGIFKNCRWLKH